MVACPKCARDSVFAPSNRYRPFCSERCRNIDLGAWANENYKISVAEPVDDFENDDHSPQPPLN